MRFLKGFLDLYTLGRDSHLCLLKGYLHSLDGPTFWSDDGYKEWRIMGVLARTDGPAVIFPEKNVRDIWALGSGIVVFPKGKRYWL